MYMYMYMLIDRTMERLVDELQCTVPVHALVLMKD